VAYNFVLTSGPLIFAVRNSGEFIAVNAKNFRKSINREPGRKHLAAEDICQS
jgi:hypothetical protein